jgi:hypothetical protein
VIRRHGLAALAALAVASCASPAAAQAPEWRIIDNSFLVEEAFNQERGVFQNIFAWTLNDSRNWQGSFTQEWPMPGMRHQFSFTIPFADDDGAAGFNDFLINYRFQLLEGSGGALAVSPRLSLILPTGNDALGLGSGKLGMQVNLPASKQLGNFYVHANAGTTWIPGIEHQETLAGSVIWQTTPMFHLMLEAVGQLGEAFTLSPGFRRGWGDEKQIVVGLAAPVTWGSGSSQVSLLTYFSYELPFRKLH